MSHHTIQFTRVSHALVDTRFECGLRLPKKSFKFNNFHVSHYVHAISDTFSG